MQFSVFAISFLASLAAASPTKRGGGGGGGSSSYVACTSTLYSQASCCGADILGLADLDCATVTETPTSLANFEAICAAGGKEARCCTLDAATLGLVCNTPA